jgi:Na+/H+ antiporter NhaD/arsenite permease-like protein
VAREGSRCVRRAVAPAERRRAARPLLALASTLAGNLLSVGSIANIIVVDAARRQGIEIGRCRHLGSGLPVRLTRPTLTAGWFAWRAGAASP